jgi:hypothetical protein
VCATVNSQLNFNAVAREILVQMFALEPHNAFDMRARNARNTRPYVARSLRDVLRCVRVKDY